MKKWIQKKFKNERGLTLVELLAVVVILAIIAVIAFVYIGGVIENSKKDAHISNAQQIISAAKLHETTISEDFDSITVGGEKGLIELDYLDEVIDPWTKKEYADLDEVEVKKTDDGYEISNFGSEKGECTISASESDINKGDRSELCN